MDYNGPKGVLPAADGWKLRRYGRFVRIRLRNNSKLWRISAWQCQAHSGMNPQITNLEQLKPQTNIERFATAEWAKPPQNGNYCYFGCGLVWCHTLSCLHKRQSRFLVCVVCALRCHEVNKWANKRSMIKWLTYNGSRSILQVKVR